MKILISNLLLTIFVFLNCSESNATDKAGSSSRSSKGREFRVRAVYRKPVNVKHESDGFFKHMGQSIEVWLNDSKTIILKADYPGHRVPSGRDYATKTFLVRLVMLERGLQIVEYVNQDGTLMAVRAPRPTCQDVMEPNDTQWFIVYFGKYFRVRLDPVTKAVKSITLTSKKEHEIVEGQRAEEVNMAGFKFFVIRGPPISDITGAEVAKESASPSIS